MTHTPEQIETMARLLCEAAGANPDVPQNGKSEGEPNWHLDRPWALGVLDALQARGWKITDVTTAEMTEAGHTHLAGDGDLESLWQAMHDAASIVPRGET